MKIKTTSLLELTEVDLKKFWTNSSIRNDAYLRIINIADSEILSSIIKRPYNNIVFRINTQSLFVDDITVRIDGIGYDIDMTELIVDKVFRGFLRDKKLKSIGL